MSNEHLLLRVEDGVATVTLNRPQALNALGTADKIDLGRLIGDLGRNRDVRVIVLTGAGDRAFCAGTDIVELETVDSASIQAVEEIEHELFSAIRRVPQPVIGRINGYALGAGLGLLMACDLTVAVADTKLGTPEVKLGVGAPVEVLILPQLVGLAKARQMLLTGELVSGTEAARMGLVNEAVPAAGLDARVAELVAHMRELAPAGVAANKRFLNAWMDHGLAAAVDLSIGLQGAVFADPETKERIRRFLERRQNSRD